MLKTDNPYGTAALMGNLYVESKLDPRYVEKNKVKAIGLTPEQYIDKIETGEYTKEQFINDSVGFGLAQWTFSSRKEALYNHAKDTAQSINSLIMQLTFMMDELKKYSSVMNAIINATNIRQASNVIVKKYEKPKNQSESFLKNRANQGQIYFDMFGNKKLEGNVIATANVNLRLGNDKKYSKIDILKRGSYLPYVAKSANGWYAVEHDKQVLWLDSQFARLI